jgi:hypothetical protein
LPSTGRAPSIQRRVLSGSEGRRGPSHGVTRVLLTNGRSCGPRCRARRQPTIAPPAITRGVARPGSRNQRRASACSSDRNFCQDSTSSPPYHPHSPKGTHT